MYQCRFDLDLPGAVTIDPTSPNRLGFLTKLQPTFKQYGSTRHMPMLFGQHYQQTPCRSHSFYAYVAVAPEREAKAVIQFTGDGTMIRVSTPYHTVFFGTAKVPGGKGTRLDNFSLFNTRS